MYESDTAVVTRYNATLTADGDFANGQYYLSGKYPLLNKKREPTGS